MTLAFSYLRFSTPEQRKGDSFRRQLAATMEFAERHGWHLSEVPFFDDGRSAFHGRNAEDGKLGEFLGAIESGSIPSGSVLIIEALDRLTRQEPLDAVPLLRRIIKAGVRIATTMNGRVYGAEQADGYGYELVEIVILLTQGHEESRKKSHRIKESWVSKRAKAESLGKPMTSRLPAWLRLSIDGNRIEVIEDRAAIVRKIFRDYLSGSGSHAIATALNEAGVPTFGRSSLWHRSYVVKVLESRAVIGEFTPHTVVYKEDESVKEAQPPIPGYFPVVVRPEEFHRVQAMRASKRSPGGRKGRPTVSYILASLAKCPRCKGAMIRENKGSSSRAGKPRLVCNRSKYKGGCDAPSVRLDAVEEAVLRALPEFSKLGHPGTSRQASESREMMVRRKAAAQRQIDNLISAMMGAGAKPEDAKRELETLPSAGAQVRKLEAQIQEINLWLEDFRIKEQQFGPRTTKAALVELEAHSKGPDYDIPKLNALLRQLVDKVTVDFDRGEIVFKWQAFGGYSRLPCPALANQGGGGR